MKLVADKKVYIFSEIKDIINKCNCKNENFELDMQKNIIVSKNLQTIKNCNNDCGLITRITIYLITNDIEYDLLNDFSIKLYIEN